MYIKTLLSTLIVLFSFTPLIANPMSSNVAQEDTSPEHKEEVRKITEKHSVNDKYTDTTYFNSLSEEQKEEMIQMIEKLDTETKAQKDQKIEEILDYLKELDEPENKRQNSKLTPENVLTMLVDVNYEDVKISPFFYKSEYTTLLFKLLSIRILPSQLDRILAYVTNINAMKDENGATAAFYFAKMSRSKTTPMSGEDKDYFDNIMKEFDYLVEKGLSLNEKDKNGKDILQVALLNGNTHIINLFIKKIKSHEINNLDEFTQKLLKIYKGGDVDYKKLPEKEQLQLYRVANQGHNHDFVNKYYNEVLKKERDPYLKSLEDDNYFFPPLWAYNIVQLEEYAHDELTRLKDRIITHDDVEHLDGKFFNLKIGEDVVKLREKEHENIGRALGADHLEKTINTLGLENQISVPRKYILVPDKNNLEIELMLPYENSQGRLSFNPTLNPFAFRIKNSRVLAENIEPATPGSDSSLLNNSAVQRVGKASGFQDYGGGSNFIRSKNDNKIYVIDTESTKNFVPKSMPYLAAEIKSQAFDPAVQRITFNISLS